MGVDSLALQTAGVEQLDRFTRLNLLGLLGQSVYELNRGNPEHAMLYLVTALVALQSSKASVALQGALAADRVLGGITGMRPLDELFQGISP